MNKRFAALTLIVVAAVIVMVITVSHIYAQKGDILSRDSIYKFMKYSRAYVPNTTSATYVGRGMVWMHRFREGRGILRPFAVEVSNEYRAKVESILRSDPDTSALLEEGYNITSIKPIVKLVAQGDGSIDVRADKVTVILFKNGSGRAIVYVDVAGSSVIEVVKCERISKTIRQSTSSDSTVARD